MRLSIALLVVAGVGSQQAAASTRATDAKAQFGRAFAALARTPRFEFTETVRVGGKAPQSVWTQIRFLAPNRMRMIVRTLAPERQQLETLQVGRVRCQAPPGVCFRSSLPKPAGLIRSFLQPRLHVKYRSNRNNAAGTIVVTITASTAAHGRYDARLTVDAASGAPRSYSMTVTRDGKVYARQRATFGYNGHFKIRLPPNARVPKP